MKGKHVTFHTFITWWYTAFKKVPVHFKITLYCSDLNMNQAGQTNLQFIKQKQSWNENGDTNIDTIK